MLPLGKTGKNLPRVRHIVNVLVRHGFGHVIEHLHVRRRFQVRGRMGREAGDIVRGYTAAERVRMALEELGPTFVKLGQLLSARPDFVPEPYSDELRKLQDSVPPFPFEEVERVVEQELGKSIGDIFEEFNPIPEAAASIAQVHAAVLSCGRKVVVKVQRPGAEQMLGTDIAILREMAPLVERAVPRMRVYNLAGLVEEFARSVRREMDFVCEGNHAELFRRNFEGDGEVVIPRVEWDLTSRKVLTMEHIDGMKIDDLEAIDRAGLDRKQVAGVGARAFLKQVFEHGLFHADPHPGNLLLLDDGRMAMVDFGIVGRIDQGLRKRAAGVLLALVEHDADRMMDECIALGVGNEGLESGEFRRDISELLDRYHGLPLREFSPENFFRDLIRVASTYEIAVPTDFILLGKTLVMVGGIARRLDPDFNLVEVAQPFARRMALDQLEARKLVVTAARTVAEFSSLLSTLPKQVEAILAKLRRGELKFEFEHRGLDASIRELDRVGNRLSFSLVVAALVIASSMIMVSGQELAFFGVPLGLLGYTAAAVLGLWLLIAILRSGRI